MPGVKVLHAGQSGLVLIRTKTLRGVIIFFGGTENGTVNAKTATTHNAE
jgi:hypothetical protein